MAAANDDDPQIAYDALAQLIRTAGRRADPPVEAYERALAAATATWQAKLRRRQRWRWSAAVAASILLASTVLPFIANSPPAPLPVAGRTDRVIGTVEMKTTDGIWTTMRGDAIDLHAGSQVRTRSGGRAGIILAGNVSLRLADRTDVMLESDSRVRVLTGKIYLDTGRASSVQPASDARRIEVITAAGVASDLGTQFEVLYRDDAYRLRVREGRVLLRRSLHDIASDAGEQLTIDAGGAIERTRLSAQDADWQWAQALAPAPDIDDQPVSALLAWVARETGKPVRFEKPEAERKAESTILHGNIRHLAPLEALSIMLATTDLEHAILDDGTILIRLKTDPGDRSESSAAKSPPAD